MGDEKGGKPTGASEDQDDAPDQDEETEGEDTDSEGSDEGSDESSDDSEDTEGEDEGASRFFDPNKLPPELKPVFKRMQAALTRKHQTFSAGIKKARAFDQLVQDPAFRAWYEGQRTGRTAAAADSDDDSDGAPTSGDPRLLTRLEKLEMAAYQNQAAQEFKEFTSAHPDWENFKQEIHDAIEEKPHLTFEEAYKLVTYDEARRLGKKDTIKDMGRKKKANTQKPGSAGPSKNGPSRPRTIQEAYELALEQAARGGR